MNDSTATPIITQPRQTAPGPKSEVPNKHDDQDPLEFLLALAREGDVVQYQSPYGAVYLINHPDHVGRILQENNFVRAPMLKLALGEGLITSEGAYWRSQRRLAQPAFHQQSIASFGTLMTDATVAMLRRWKAFAEKGEPIEVAAEMTRLTLGIIGKALFGVDLTDQAESLIEAITIVVEDLGSIMRTVFDAPHRMDPSRNRRLKRSLQAFDRIVYGIIEQRRRQNNGRRDLLALLLSGLDGTTGKILNDRQLRDEVVTMLVAGHETTANMLSWTWYLLSENPGVERRLHAELAEIVGSRLPTIHDLQSLPYHRMVLQESLRLYPPVWFITRTNLVEEKIGDFTIPINSRIILSPYAMHRNSAFWQNPEQFDPERFLPERSKGRPHYAYFPFAGGHHLCLGNNLSMTEGQLVLATVGQHYRLRLVPGHPVEPDPLITLRHRHGLPMTLVSRTDLPIDG